VALTTRSIYTSQVLPGMHLKPPLSLSKAFSSHDWIAIRSEKTH